MLKERLSYSLVRNLLSKPLDRVVYEIKNKDFVRSDAMQRGLLFEYVLHSGIIPDEVWYDSKTRAVNFEKWRNNLGLEEHECCTSSEAEELKEFLGSMKSQGITDLVNGMRYQEHFERKDVHAYFDFSNDEIVYDMKFTAKADNWEKAVYQEHYDVQAYIATMDGREFAWIVVEDSAPFTTFIGDPSFDVIQSGKEKYESALPLFKKLNKYTGLGPAQTKRIDLPRWVKKSNQQQ